MAFPGVITLGRCYFTLDVRELGRLQASFFQGENMSFERSKRKGAGSPEYHSSQVCWCVTSGFLS